MFRVALMMEPDKENIQRIGYTVFDLLSDIGGISSIFGTTFASVLSFLNYLYFDTFFASKLFKLRSHKDHKKQDISFTPSKFSCIKEYIPSKFCCYQKSRKQRMIEKARKQMDNEIDFIYLVKQIRYF